MSRPPRAKRLPSAPIGRSGCRRLCLSIGSLTVKVVAAREGRVEKAAEGCNGLDGRIGFDGRRRGGSITVILATREPNPS